MQSHYISRLQEAFGTVDHGILIKKLRVNEIREKAGDWFEYLWHSSRRLLRSSSFDCSLERLEGVS